MALYLGRKQTMTLYRGRDKTSFKDVRYEKLVKSKKSFDGGAHDYFSSNHLVVWLRGAYLKINDSVQICVQLLERLRHCVQILQETSYRWST